MVQYIGQNTYYKLAVISIKRWKTVKSTGTTTKETDLTLKGDNGQIPSYQQKRFNETFSFSCSF